MASDKGLEGRPFWEDMPELPPELEWVYRAFGDLSGSRRAAGGRIPWESAAAYADRFGIEDLDAFWALIRAMDSVYLDHIGKEFDRGN